ncbi:MAG: 2-oxo acid dehydrogenase subunit E2 [Candidatus Dormibacteraeota bacterium]|uniref:Dihydrolipoamide acetyltransferase component of pyruvate dehydrogenase complex n=1 Tax=Candidatus Amunia macphersoniae TaxID=3127014 RepID=A0A934KRY3_9BACT|nr:2-oxo acid dehydrogenase subunit E2 [Candidatus Dormibacteraeota bacterium]
MAMTVTMPQLGESVTEGTIARWLKQPGELVSKYESIAEVVTDKVNAEIPAPAEGSMGELIAKEGTVVAVGEPICTIETSEQGQANSAWHQGDDAQKLEEQESVGGPAADAPAVGPAESEPAPEPVAAQAQGDAPQSDTQPGDDAQPQRDAPAAAAAAEPAPAAQDGARQPAAAGDNGSGRTNGDLHVTPAVRMLVREHDIDLSQVQGTGLGGRISKKDVLAFVQRRDAGGGGARPAAQPVGAATAAVLASPQQPRPRTVGGDETVPLTPTRRAIAEHMVRSIHTSPHAWLSMEVDMAGVAALRGSRRADFEQRYGAKLTYLPFVARAVCEALRQYPTLNSTWGDDGIILRHEIHLGIAVALEDNLIVPVVRNADRLSIAGLATAMQDLGDRARANRLKLDEIQGGTFTLNNTGALGTVHTVPIINQPQAAILAMDAVIKRAVVVNDAIAIRPMMNLGLSFDHRINDGLGATRFTKTVKEILENIDHNAALL